MDRGVPRGGDKGSYITPPSAIRQRELEKQKAADKDKKDRDERQQRLQKSLDTQQSKAKQHQVVPKKAK